ncbi:MAG: alkaline phosphatase family protein [Verrucomicrobiales bacterium]|nr:alkaline phosphatase family protein [Verrucomicrobiales bacterium]
MKTTLTLALYLCCFGLIAGPLEADEAKPKLVLQITVDQLRGDFPTRFLDRMPEGGFRWLLDNGVVYKNAHHGHANTETIVGHTTLATGAYPSVHGMIGNVWFDRQSGDLTYNIEDPRYSILTKGAGVDKSQEIDPTQRVAKSDGRSPAAILCSTFSDELAIQTAGKAKIFGVSVKDRGAVSMAGHAGKAFWFSKSAGEFVSSNFYYEKYPEWVEKWNEEKHTSRYGGKAWELMLDQSTYLFGDRDDQEWETTMLPFGRTFPHSYGSAEGKGFTTFLTLSPAGDELTLDFAKALVENEEIGQDEITDYLSVSFSSTDYVGHLFGASSLEAEDNLLHLDRTIASLLSFIDEKVGLENTIIAFSADHGGPEVPADLNQLGFEAKYVQPEKWEKEAGFESLKKRFSIGEDLVREYAHPYLYLNREIIVEKGLDPAEVEEAVAEELVKFEGVALAISSTALSKGEVSGTEVVQAVLNNHHPKRSGDIYVVFEPHWFINDMDGLVVAATHGSPWRYDTFVPVIFAGFGTQAATIYREIETTSLAPTLSALLGTKSPSGSFGEVLVEVMNRP